MATTRTTFKKRQRELQLKERRQEKLERRLSRKGAKESKGDDERVKTYVPLENAAQRLNVTKEDLLQLNAVGWISVITRHDALFLEGRDEYKARFILHLQRSLHLSDEQIARVLFVQEPPYSLEGIDKILSEAVVLDGKP